MVQTKFLITGATDATGGHAARQLLEKEQAVRVLAHRSACLPNKYSIHLVIGSEQI
jgi:nucleoside-diphosphate-sugar epimerase